MPLHELVGRLFEQLGAGHGARRDAAGGHDAAPQVRSSGSVSPASSSASTVPVSA
jgi:hypothetical protein